MNVRAYEVLELDKVRERLASFAETAKGRARALDLEPETDPERIRAMIEETSEARRLEDEGETTPLRDLPEIELVLDILAVEGRFLDVPDFVSLVRFGSIASTVRERLEARAETLPRLFELGKTLPPLHALETQIHRIVDTDQGEVKDNASPDLKKLRAQATRLKKRLQKLLDATIASRDHAKILQEPIVTTRNGRLVVPIKAECKPQFPGIVHAASSSGATLFVEPMSTVEVGNEIASVQDRERQELRRILGALTERVRPFASALAESSEAMTRIDEIQAKGRLSASYAGEPPQMSASDLRLVEARHPLLKEPVPISFHLAGGRRALLFTGPNTGGKTVALKTAGLLSLMAQAGLHVPASSESVFPVFHSIFADIGDDQSIASNLSTFSAHLAKVVEMEREIELPALVILDEVGTGTDPAEGGALGTALVEHFLDEGALVVASTHHGLLKAYASTTDGVGSASFQFDPKTYAPTFEIVDGMTGKSLAFEMAARLGLPKTIVDRARELQSESERQVRDLVHRLETEGAELEKERALAEQERRAAARARARIEAEADEDRRARAESLRSFRETLQDELHHTQREIRELVAEAKRARNEQSSRLAELERALETKLQAITSPLLEKTQSVAPEPHTPPLGALEPGTRVLVASFGMEGEIVQLVGRTQAEVLVHDKKLRLPVAGLELLPPVERVYAAAKLGESTAIELKEIPGEINLIGCTVDEALERADKYLDDAFLSDRREVRLIHGHGRGRLKSAIREWLTSHPHVANQRSESRGGVTVVELKD